MGLFDKAKELSEMVGDKVSEKSNEFISDEFLSEKIMKAVEKQEKVNTILKEKGSNYRILDLDLVMSIPPSIVFGIRRVSGQEVSKVKEETLLIEGEGPGDKTL